MSFQVDGVQWLATRKHSLLADHMGLGKTLQAIALCNYLASTPVLVVTPASIRLQWSREFDRFSVPSRRVEVVYSNTQFPTECDVLIIGYDSLRKHRRGLRSRKWEVVVFDEAHYLKNRSSIRAKECMGHLRPEADGHIPPLAAGKKIFMTGTPIMNRPTELWPILHAIDPKKWDRFLPFAKKYNGWPDRWGNYRSENARHLGDLKQEISTVMLRRTKQAVLKQLPDKRSEVVVLDSAGHAKLIRREWELARLDPDPATPEFGELATARRELGEAKVKPICDHLRMFIDADVPVVCFCCHLSVLKAIRESVGNCSVITGATALRARQLAVDKFMDGQAPVFLAQIKAGGTGIDGLQKRASNVVFAELDWTQAVHDQAGDRLHRIGQSRGVLVQYMGFSGSLDATIADKLAVKKKISDQLLGSHPV